MSDPNIRYCDECGVYWDLRAGGCPGTFKTLQAEIAMLRRWIDQQGYYNEAATAYEKLAKMKQQRDEALALLANSADTPLLRGIGERTLGQVLTDSAAD